MAEVGQDSKYPVQVEEPKDPTNTSKFFLKRWGDAINAFYDRFPMEANIASSFVSSLVVAASLKEVNNESPTPFGIVNDIVGGHYERAVARGIIIAAATAHGYLSVKSGKKQFRSQFS